MKMTTPISRQGLLAALVATLAIAGCKCGSSTQSAGCTSDEQCIAENKSDLWFCNTEADPSVCEEASRQCNTAADCCPAQACNQQLHICADRYTRCTGPGSCPARGAVCKTIGVFVRGEGCTWERCGTLLTKGIGALVT